MNRIISGSRWGTMLLAGALVFLYAQPGEAKVLEIWVQGQGGGLYGFYGTEDYDPVQDQSPAEDDFFKAHSGGAFGLQLGVEVFFVDVIIDFAQLYDKNGLSATLTSFMLGFDYDYSLSKSWVLTPYGMGGFAFATYNNDWVKDDYEIDLVDLQGRGALARGGARLEVKLHEMLRVGVDAGAGYHYMLQTNKMANDPDGHSHGFHGYVMGFVRFQWEPFKKSEETEEIHPDDVKLDEEPKVDTSKPEPAPEPASEPEPEPAPARQVGASAGAEAEAGASGEGGGE